MDFLITITLLVAVACLLWLPLGVSGNELSLTYLFWTTGHCKTQAFYQEGKSGKHEVTHHLRGGW